MKEQQYIHVQVFIHLFIWNCIAARVDWKASPNSQVSPFDCGTPGTLPDLNWHCIELAIRAALITNSTISSKLLFDRKHYEHWDLPAGYQITQHRQPLATNGYIEIGLDGVESNKRKRKVRIKQIHVEQVFFKLKMLLNIDFFRIAGNLFTIMTTKKST